MRRTVALLRQPTILVLGGYGFFGSRVVQLLGKTDQSPEQQAAQQQRGFPEGLYAEKEDVYGEVAPQFKKRAFNMVVAGRNYAEAESFCISFKARNDFDAQPAQLGLRDLRVPNMLKSFNVDMVINCTGPFYDPTVQWDSAIAARTCAKANIHYIDIGESAKHHELLKEKMQALVREEGRNIVGNRATITGASTVPSLSSAAIEEALEELAKNEFMRGASTKDVVVRVGMNPGNNTPTPVGVAAFKSVLMRVGAQAPVIVDGAQTTVPSWTPDKTMNFPSARIGQRAMGIVESPDVSLVVDCGSELAGTKVKKAEDGEAAAESGKPWKVKGFTFAAGLERPLLQKLLSVPWFQGSGLLKALKMRSIMRLVHGCFNLCRGFLGSKHGGMFVSIVHPERNCGVTWELTAFEGDGAFVPCLAAVATARRLLLSRKELDASGPCLKPGDEIQTRGISSCERYTATGRRMSPSLGEILQAGETLDLQTATARSMYHHILGDEKFDALHPALRRFHSLQCDTKLDADVVAIVPCNFGKAVCWFLSLPTKLGDAKTGKTEPFTFELRPGPFEALWIRHYPRQAPMVSRMRALSFLDFDPTAPSGVSSTLQLVEQLGPFSIVMNLGHARGRESPGGQALSMEVASLKLFGTIPLPKVLLPLSVTAIETGSGDGSAEDPYEVNFFVKASLPFIGPLVQYEGSVQVPA